MLHRHLAYLPRRSCASLTARSRTSGGNLFVLFMVQFIQRLKPPQNLMQFGFGSLQGMVDNKLKLSEFFEIEFSVQKERLREVSIHCRHPTEMARLWVRQQPQFRLALVEHFSQRHQVGIRLCEEDRQDANAQP